MNTRGWKYKINIKQYLTEEDDNPAVIKACAGVVEELKKLPETLDGVVMIIQEFEELAEWAADSDDGEEWCEEFNYNLEKLYNWADYERVWTGL